MATLITRLGFVVLDEVISIISFLTTVRDRKPIVYLDTEQISRLSFSVDNVFVPQQALHKRVDYFGSDQLVRLQRYTTNRLPITRPQFINLPQLKSILHYQVQLIDSSYSTKDIESLLSHSSTVRSF